MWPHLVVVAAARLAFSDRVVEAHEPVLVQALHAERAVEGLDERVVGRLAMAAEVERDVGMYAHRSNSREMNSLS